MRTITIIYVTVCAVINVTVAGAFGYAVWTDHHACKARQAAEDLAAANEADDITLWAREMGHV